MVVLVIGEMLGALGCLFLVVTAVSWLGAFVHRSPPAHGDVELACELSKPGSRPAD